MSSEYFNRLKGISATVVPNEESLITYQGNDFQDFELNGI